MYIPRRPTAENIVELADQVKVALREGRYIEAFDLLPDANAMAPMALEIQVLKARALIGCEDLEGARVLLTELQGMEESVEILGNLASVLKRIALRKKDAQARRAGLAESRDLYLSAYRKFPDSYWTGINAATLSLVLGDSKAETLAEGVRAQMLQLIATDAMEQDEQFWGEVTLAEALLVLKRVDEAKEMYSRATRGEGLSLTRIASTRKNTRLITQALELDEEALEGVFPIPRVLAFAGHMLDREGRKNPRFPKESLEFVRKQIVDQLQGENPIIAYAAASAGSDIVFLEEVHNRGGVTHVVLPFEVAEFRRRCVVDIAGEDWGKKFDDVLAQAESITECLEYQESWERLSYEYANSALTAHAISRARELSGTMEGLACWDGQSGDGPGGTASCVRWWQQIGVEPTIIAPTENKVQAASSVIPVEEVKEAWNLTGLLFADFKGFSKLSEQQVITFADKVLGMVARLLKAGVEPLARNTWGDGLHLVYERPKDAAEFAVTLQEAMTGKQWIEEGLPEDLAVRISLHAGPTMYFEDPVTGRANYMGRHVSRAARIEPKTPEGQIYASASFASLAMPECLGRIRFTHVGMIELPKDYGLERVYHVRRET